MNHLRPILRGHPTRTQKLVLASAKLDRPPSHGKSQTLAALGLGGTVLATHQAASAVSASSVTSTSAPAAIGFGIATLKGIAAGLVAGSLVYGSMVAMRESAQPAAHYSKQERDSRSASSRRQLPQLKSAEATIVGAPVATIRITPPGVNGTAISLHRDVAPVALPDPLPSAKSQDTPIRASAPSGPARAHMPHASTLPAAETPLRSDARVARGEPDPASPGLEAVPATGSRQSKPSVVTQPSLESEVAALDIARRALAAGHPAIALQNLDHHRRLFAKPRLLPEATLVRIEALLALGRSIEARMLAEELLRAQPTGALAQRVKSLLNPIARY